MTRTEFSTGEAAHPQRLPLLVIVAAILWTVSPTAQAAWQISAIGSSDAHSFACDSAMQTSFVVTNQWNLWRSTDSGSSWQGLRSQAFPERSTNLYRIRALDAGGDTLVAKGMNMNSQGAYAWSFDGGTTWQRYQEPYMTGTGISLQVWRTRHNVWFCYEGDYFGVSDDYGESWTYRTPFNLNDNARGLYRDPSDDSTLYAFGTYSYSSQQGTVCAGVNRSTNLGQTWTMLALDGLGLDWAEVEDVIRLSNGDLLALTWITEPWWDNGNVLLSTDDGASWTRVYGGLPDRFRPTIVVEDELAPGTLFLAGASRYSIFWSQDFGRTWSPCANGLPTNSVMPGDLFQSPFNKAIYVSIWGYGAYGTSDHGVSWFQVAGPPIAEMGELHAVNGTTLYRTWGACRQWRLSGDANTWSEISAPLALDTMVLMGTLTLAHGDTFVAGISKRPFSTPTDHFQMAYSSNAGDTWDLDPFLPFDPVTSVEVLTRADTTYFAAVYGSTNSLYVSADLGHNWTPRPFPHYYPFSYRDWTHTDEAIYIIESNGIDASRIYRSADLGESWDDLEYVGPYLWGTTSLAAIGAELYVVTEDTGEYRCLHWADGQWDERGTILDSVIWSALVPIIAEDTILVGVSHPATLWVSHDFGYTWIRREYELPYGAENRGLGSVAYDSVHARLWASTRGGVCYLELAELSADGPLTLHPSAFSLSAYPNPFNSTTRIRYDLEQAGKVELSVYDLQGRLVETLVDDLKTAGRHERNFNGEKLASGTYFVRLHTHQHTRTEKILLLK